MKCKICESQSIFFANAHVLNKYNVAYFQCGHCGFVQTEEPYWLEEAYVNPIAQTDSGLVFRNHMLARITSNVITKFFNPEADFLDYGAGYGLFVRLMRDTRFNFYWYDKYCENLFAKEWETQLQDDKQYELITAFEIFEHLVDPFQEVKQLLKHSRNIFLSTELLPNSHPKPQEWWYYAPHEGQHISLYTSKSLSILAERLGLNFYSNGSSLHLLTDKDISQDFFEKLTTYNSLVLKDFLLGSRDYVQVFEKIDSEQYKIQWQQTQKELEESEAQRLAVESELQQSKSQLHAVQAELVHCQSQLHNSEIELDKSQAQLHASQEELEQLHAKLSKTEIELTQTQVQLQSSQEELVQTRLRVQSSQEELARSQAQLYQTKAELERSGFKLHHTEAELVQSQTQLDRMQQTEIELAQCQAQLHQAKAELEQSQFNLRRTETELAKSQQELSETKSVLYQTGTQFSQSQAELSELKSALNQSEEQLQQTQSQFHLKFRDLKRLQSQLHQTQEEVEHFQEQLKVVQKEFESQLQASQREMESQLQASQEQLERSIFQRDIDNQTDEQKQIQYRLLVWEGWYAYYNNDLSKMRECLQASLNSTFSSRTETINNWLESFAVYSLEKGCAFDPYALSSTDEWKQLMQRVLTKRNISKNF